MEESEKLKKRVNLINSSIDTSIFKHPLKKESSWEIILLMILSFVAGVIITVTGIIVINNIK